MNRFNVSGEGKAGVAAIACITALLLASAASGLNAERYDEDTTSQLIWWNNDSVKRIWGCDKCNIGDIACSLGSSTAQMMGWPCGYKKETADYYGYFDIDDQRRLGTPNLYKWMDGQWDTKMDYESGIPDGAVSDPSVESIHSNVTAYFVKEVEWKGPPYWIHMHDPGPWGKKLDMNRWVMPCDVQGEDWCRWTDCYQILPCPCQEHLCPGKIAITLQNGDVVCQACDAAHGGPANCDPDTGRYNTEASCSCGTVSPDPPVSCVINMGSNTWCQERYGPGNIIIGEVWDNCPCVTHPCPKSGGDGSGWCQDSVSGRPECSQCDALNTDPPGGSIDVKKCGPTQNRCKTGGAGETCSYTVNHPLSYCYGGSVPDGELGNKNYQWGCWDCTNVYNETEDPDNPKDVQELRDFCGWGGTRIVEEVRDEKMFGYENYPLKRDATGNDVNDDVKDYKEIPNLFTQGVYFPGMPLVLASEGSGAAYEQPTTINGLIVDYKKDDMVRDRFWRHNATNQEFSGTRPGYCSGECSGTSCAGGPTSVPCQQQDLTTQRDGLDRPSSRQHDPCRSCWDNLDEYYWDKLFTGNPATDYKLPCSNTCFNYDIRYYRQFNLGSVWTNVFKIVPEVNDPRTRLPPGESFPDVRGLCLQTKPGKYVCSKADIGATCANPDACIPGLDCVTPLDAAQKVCCPAGTYYEKNCCRQEPSGACTAYETTCPADLRSPPKGRWPEYAPDNYRAWIKESPKGLQRQYDYLFGVGEEGCLSDADCAEYLDPEDYTKKVTLHCSKALGKDGAWPTADVIGYHCCPEDYEYDISFNCCLPATEAVRIVRMHDMSNIYRQAEGAGPPVDTGYCEEKYLETDKKCKYEEGPCRMVNRQGDRMDYNNPKKECDADLQCKQNYANIYIWDTACCRQEQMWNGKNCVPLLTQAPWVATWTRTKEGVNNDGGGPIWIYSGAGAMIPNMTEAAGWMDSRDGNNRVNTFCKKDGRFRTILINGLSRFPLYALGCGPEASPASTDQKTGAAHPELQLRGVCRYCDGAWPYQCNPSPIWFEARNFGNDYRAGWRQTTCNGLFAGVDASVYPYDTYNSTTVSPLYKAPSKLECWGKDCNCGRDMDGNSVPRVSPWPDARSPLDTVGDQADGMIFEAGGPNCAESVGNFVAAYTSDPLYQNEASKVSCNALQSTSCKRGKLDPKTEHRCNFYPWGHGRFLELPKKLNSNTTVDPRLKGWFKIGNTGKYQFVDPIWNGVDAKEIIPEVCARIQRKEVVYDTDSYYPRTPGQPSVTNSGDSPYSWFDYTIKQYDENHNPLAPIIKTNVEPGRINILPQPASPWTVLRDNKIQVELDTNTRYINVTLNYTVRNRIERQDFVKQCSWVGCSRIEEVVTKYEGTRCYEQCDKSWSCTNSPITTVGPPPCCCTPQNRSDPAVTEGRKRECVVNRTNPLARGDCWACKNTYRQICGMTPAGVPIFKTLRIREEHDCNCQYACWGCWHLNGETDYQPVTEADPTQTAAYNNQKEVREEINESARVEARPYGDHIRVENPITMGNSEAKVKVRGRIIYGYPDVDMDTTPDALKKRNTFMSGFLTFQAVDDETGKIDMFGGVRLSVPDIVTLDLFTKRYPLYHELSGLKSTLPHDYVNITAGQRTLLRLPDQCYRRIVPSGEAYMFQPNGAASPFYLRWLFNSAKQYTAYYDIFQGHGTQYNLEGPVWLADLGNTLCKNFLDERSANIPLYRTYHENEPLAYDFESVFIVPVDIEAGLRYDAYDPSSLTNVKSIAYKKSVEKVYARYAPSCSLPPQNGYSLSGGGACPDMCSDIAEPTGGGCDCQYRAPYRKKYPISEDVCKLAGDWRMSELSRCEGAPGKYKSFCADGKYYAYWEDQYQFRYKWNAGTNSCAIDMLKACEPKEFPPESYTIVFQNPKTLTYQEWNTAIAKVYSNLRNVEYKAFGDQDPCTSQTYTYSNGGLDVSIEKPKPVYYVLTGSGTPTPETEYTMTVEAKSPCGGSIPPSGKKSVYIQFLYPYAYATGWYAQGDTIKVTLKKGSNVVAIASSLEDGGFTKSIKYISKIDVAYETPMCDYLMNNIWVLVVIWVMVMSYRFFGERMSDFKEWFDEYQGKK